MPAMQPAGMVKPNAAAVQVCRKVRYCRNGIKPETRTMSVRNVRVQPNSQWWSAWHGIVQTTARQPKRYATGARQPQNAVQPV